MKEWVRPLLGISLVVTLIPVLSFSLTGRFDSWIPGDEASVPATATPTHNDIAQPEALSDNRATETSIGSTQTKSSSSPLRVGEFDPRVDRGADTDSSPANKPDKSDADEAPKSTDTTTETPTTTKAPASSAPEATDIITGKACPCEVQRVAELRGTVDLQGDIVVTGGTLVARPGVTVNGNGHQIMFMDGGRADFEGSKTSTWSGDGSNANVSRDITFRDLRRIMFHEGAGQSTLSYISVVDSGTSALGDYPIHFHLNGNSTRGTLVEGVAVVNGRHHAFVPHGSHGITFKDTIAKNTKGDAYWWDGPGTNESCTFPKQCTLDNSNDIMYDHALAIGVTNGPNDNRGFRLAGFLLGAGSGNVIKNSVATNVSPSHVKDCAGFHWPQGANQNVGGNVWTFSNNESSSKSGCHGIFVWQNDSNHHVISGFQGGGLDHGAYANKYDFRKLDVPYVQIHATGWRMSDSDAGDVVAFAHVQSGSVVFESVTFDSFTVDDAGEKPANYIINNSNLSCSDIDYKGVAAGSKVVIDGEDC